LTFRRTSQQISLGGNAAKLVESSRRLGLHLDNELKSRDTPSLTVRDVKPKILGMRKCEQLENLFYKTRLEIIQQIQEPEVHEDQLEW
ncbi:unnamed protein product, partial [Porites lobata]